MTIDPYAAVVLLGLAVAVMAAIVDLIGRAVTRRRHRRASAGLRALGASMLGAEPGRRK